MRNRASEAFFERAVTIHRFDCEAMEGMAPEDTRPKAGEISGLMPDDRAVRYGLGARASYDAMRRLIGQLAGLSILLAVSGRRDLLVLPDIQLARERWHGTGTSIAALDAPALLARHLASLKTAHGVIGELIESLEGLEAATDIDTVIDRMAGLLKQAYRVLQDASEPRIGMTMVDFSHACCSCALR